MTEPTLLMTRPQASAERFVAGLKEGILTHVRVLFSPLVAIKPTGASVDLSDYSGVIFTSANGVTFAPQGDAGSAYCVGTQTATAADETGWTVKTVEQTADDLVRAICDLGIQGPLAHLAGVHRRGNIAERLAAAGIPVSVYTCYDQLLRPLSDEAQQILSGEAPVIVPLFSPRTAQQFVEEAVRVDHVHVVAMSQAVGQVLDQSQVAGVDIAPFPTGEDMARGVELALRRVSSA